MRGAVADTTESSVRLTEPIAEREVELCYEPVDGRNNKTAARTAQEACKGPHSSIENGTD